MCPANAQHVKRSKPPTQCATSGGNRIPDSGINVGTPCGSDTRPVMSGLQHVRCTRSRVRSGQVRPSSSVSSEPPTAPMLPKTSVGHCVQAGQDHNLAPERTAAARVQGKAPLDQAPDRHVAPCARAAPWCSTNTDTSTPPPQLATTGRVLSKLS